MPTSAIELDERQEAAWLDFLQERRALQAAGYDESQHPRHPDGRWRRKDEAPEAVTNDAITLGSARDPGWTGPVVGPADHTPQLTGWGGRGAVDPIALSDEVWDWENPGAGLFHGGVVQRDRQLNAQGSLSDESYRQQVAQRFAEEVRNGEVAVAADAGVIPDIISDGRLKNQFDTGTSSGVMSWPTRVANEELQFGYPYDTPAEERPIYGIVSRHGGERAHEQYGNAYFYLKPEVQSRTTVTSVDSLNRPVIPGPFRNPGWRAALPPGYVDTAVRVDDSLFNHREYVEAQVHGGVRLSDVARVELTRDNWWGDEAELEEYAEQLRAAGIPTEIVDD